MASNGEKKRAIVVRYGAIGDCIIITPVFKELKKQGYHVTFNCTKKGLDIVKNNPHVDEVLIHHDTHQPWEELQDKWSMYEQEYDRFINLTQTLEVALLPGKGDKLFWKSHEERHRECNVNYYDYALRRAGFDITGRNGEIYLSEEEKKLCESFMKKFRGKFVVMWALTGSSPHKAYPWTEYIVEELQRKYRDIAFVTVGDEFSRFLEWGGRDTYNASGKWSVRRTLSMTKFVDLVIGPETGVLHAAGCFDTPKILMLTHSSEENISKYWKNCVSVHAPEEIVCYPCHRLIHSVEDCPKSAAMQRPACIVNIHPLSIIRAFDQFYRRAA